MFYFACQSLAAQCSYSSIWNGGKPCVPLGQSIHVLQLLLTWPPIFALVFSFCVKRPIFRRPLMASALGSSPSQGHRVVFLGETLHSHSASLNQVYKWVPANCRGNFKTNVGG